MGRGRQLFLACFYAALCLAHGNFGAHGVADPYHRVYNIYLTTPAPAPTSPAPTPAPPPEPINPAVIWGPIVGVAGLGAAVGGIAGGLASSKKQASSSYAGQSPTDEVVRHTSVGPPRERGTTTTTTSSSFNLTFGANKNVTEKENLANQSAISAALSGSSSLGSLPSGASFSSDSGSGTAWLYGLVVLLLLCCCLVSLAFACMKKKKKKKTAKSGKPVNPTARTAVTEAETAPLMAPTGTLPSTQTMLATPTITTTVAAPAPQVTTTVVAPEVFTYAPAPMAATTYVSAAPAVPMYTGAAPATSYLPATYLN